MTASFSLIHLERCIADKRSPAAQATTYLQLADAAAMQTGEDVAHLLARLPGLRCVGIGGDWAGSPEAWAAVMPSLSVCQDLRFLGVGSTLEFAKIPSHGMP